MNFRNTSDDRVSEDIRELQQFFDNSDTDIMPDTNNGVSKDPQGRQNGDEDEDAEGSEDPELFGSIYS